MRQSTAGLTIIAGLGLYATVASPAVAAEIALVGCDLQAEDGPVAVFLQIAGEEPEQDNRFVFRSGDALGDTLRDVAGRSCAEVLAELANDGFEYQDADVSRGSFSEEWVSIWQAPD